MYKTSKAKLKKPNRLILKENDRFAILSYLERRYIVVSARLLDAEIERRDDLGDYDRISQIMESMNRERIEIEKLMKRLGKKVDDSISRKVIQAYHEGWYD